MAPESLTPAIAALLSEVGHGGGSVSVAPLASGGNNRVFAVSAAEEKFVAKWYFHAPDDHRDRLHAEYCFISHAWNSGICSVPQPIRSDPRNHIALYEHVEGRQLTASDVTSVNVRSAASFFAALNTQRSRAAGETLAPASEACLSVADSLRSVERRLARLTRLADIPAMSPIEREAIAFVSELTARWAQVRQQILTESTDQEVPGAWPSLSPSDFGFHNALMRPSGDLCFIDFEYAGWDDAAKAIADFFTHPGIPVSSGHFEDFAVEASSAFDKPSELVQRARMLEPVCRLKWCCIILNEFLPEAARRRRFADPATDLEARKTQQLRKAQAHLAAANY